MLSFGHYGLATTDGTLFGFSFDIRHWERSYLLLGPLKILGIEQADFLALASIQFRARALQHMTYMDCNSIIYSTKHAPSRLS
jgi:hypothetical protein